MYTSLVGEGLTEYSTLSVQGLGFELSPEAKENIENQ